MNMNRTYTALTNPNLDYLESRKKAAIHEAGHAAAIYLGNLQKGLPLVNFKICLHPISEIRKPSNSSKIHFDDFPAKVEGGRLITELPSSLEIAKKTLTSQQCQNYQLAFEADIINLLAGPIAEARYVALRDDEVISPRLVNLNALRNYGGETDMEIAHKYFECINEPAEDKEKKIIGLYLSAFTFVCERGNWQAITALADYISATDKSIIERDEIISILENARNYSKFIH